MAENTPNHYSYKFKFAIDSLPAEQKDRISGKLSVLGIIFGLAFVALAVFEAVSYFYFGTDSIDTMDLSTSFSANEILLQRYVFDAIILVLGLIIVVVSIISLKRHKVIFFDGENIKMTYYSPFKQPKTEIEALYNYLGVLLRVEYFQLGLMSRNRYIIELYHPEKNKRVPLYLTTSSRNVRKMWEYYAEKLKLPALFMTDHGLISRHHSELNKTLGDMAAKWHLNSLYREDNSMPSSVKCKVMPHKVVVKERRLFFDIYSILALFGVLILGALMGYAIYNYPVIVPYVGAGGFAAFMFLCGAIALFSIIVLFSKDVLIITDEEIVLGHNILFLRRNAEYVKKDEIAAVDIGHNPTTDRFYLSVIADNQSLIFGKNMPVNDLRWVRGFIIKQITK
ncbi:MAG: hypothetical protein IJ099_06845 [Alphaproteobacteria bacterium]|nr:hypothetical protein [Alphaproteobacteria bacterium]